MTVRARSSGIPDSSRCRSMSATHAATCSAVGGSAWRWRSCRRTDPMSIDTACRSVALPEHQLGRPAADVDDEHRLGRHRDLRGDRAGEDERGLLVAGQHLRLDAEATRVRPRRRRPRCSRRGSPTSRRTGPARTGRRGRGASRRTRRSPRRCAPAPRRPARPVRSTPCPRRTIAGLAQRHVELAVVAHGRRSGA